MANPNVVAVSSISAQTVLDADVAASAVSLLTCASDKLCKINSLVIANIDGTKTITVSADSTLLPIDKNMGLYLNEGDILKIQASAAGDLSAVCSYEEIDDA